MYGVIAKTGSQLFIFCLTDTEVRARSLYNSYRTRSINSSVLGISAVPDNALIGDNFDGVIQV
jgi:hypothetical protein